MDMRGMAGLLMGLSGVVAAAGTGAAFRLGEMWPFYVGIAGAGVVVLIAVIVYCMYNVNTKTRQCTMCGNTSSQGE